MKIETKFSYSDTPYIMYENKVYQCKILSIKSATGSGDTYITYKIKVFSCVPTELEDIDEKLLFSSKKNF